MPATRAMREACCSEPGAGIKEVALAQTVDPRPACPFLLWDHGRGLAQYVPSLRARDQPRCAVMQTLRFKRSCRSGWRLRLLGERARTVGVLRSTVFQLLAGAGGQRDAHNSRRLLLAPESNRLSLRMHNALGQACAMPRAGAAGMASPPPGVWSD